MKQSLFKIISISLFLLLSPGCALLPFGHDDDTCQIDPVACAAMSQRLPGDREEARTDGSGPSNEGGPTGGRSPASTGQLTLGMSRRDVKSLWGAPHDVEVAGDARLGNERWVYYNGLSSAWSISHSRAVYFEDGRVVGWESGR